MAVASSLTIQIRNRLMRPHPPPPPPSSSFPRPFPSTVAYITGKHVHNTTANITTTFFSFFSSLPTSPYPLLDSHTLSLSSSLNALTHSLSVEQEQEEDGSGEIEDMGSGSSEILELEENGVDVSPNEEGLKRKGSNKVPNLTVKEKKELASYAHGLGKKLKSQLVGKSGVTDNVAASFIETLEANELLKIKIHRTCPGELEAVVQQLEEATGSVVVGQIGRTVIVYRPSVSKLEAEEKKKQARRVFVRKNSKLKPTSLPRGQMPRLSGRGHRGSSRM